MSDHGCWFPTSFWLDSYWQCRYCGQRYVVRRVGRWGHEWKPTTAFREWFSDHLFGVTLFGVVLVSILLTILTA